MSYLGDAELGDGTNVGAGTITANYDGRQKHRTTIGKRVFLGVDTMLRAPLTSATTRRPARAPSSRRTSPPGKLAVGVPARIREPAPDRARAATDAGPPARRSTILDPRHRLLTFLEGFFVAGEIALVSIRRSRVEQLVDEGSAGARRVRRLLEEPGRFLAVSQLGLTVIGFFASAYAAVSLVEGFATVLVGVGVDAGTRRGASP